ncbi:hypothetical protein C8F01DRAFT_1369492 [Mycena amicta]|nr:hypothetical protein C8F01DRAFT_1369492 [Mycena amicta]
MNVVVDDRDPAVQYTPAWETADIGLPIEFGSTTSRALKNGDTARFSFTGTSVAVYGTIGPQTGVGSSMSFSIDGGSSTSFSAPTGPSTTYHQRFFESSFLPDAAHTLQITSTSAAPSQLFLDYFLVQTTEVAGKQVFIDDSDTDSVHYGGQWGTVPAAATTADLNFQQTIHFTQQPGAWVSVTFQGTQLTLHGPNIIRQSFSASAVIDSDQNTTPLIPSAPPAPAPSTVPAGLPTNFNFNNVLFTSRALSQGTHTANITFKSGQPLYVDYFLVSTNADLGAPAGGNGSNSGSTPSPAGTGSGSSTIPQSVSSTRKASSSGTPDGSIPSDSTQAAASGSSAIPPGAGPTGGVPGQQQVGGASSSANSSHPNIGAIVGGVIAGILLLVLLFFACGFLRRRYRQAKKKRLSPASAYTDSDFVMVSGPAAHGATRLEWAANAGGASTSASAAAAHNTRDSLATLADSNLSTDEKYQQEPEPEDNRRSRYLYYPGG